MVKAAKNRTMRPIVEAYYETELRIAKRTFACPECGSEGPHEDNGCRGDDQAFCCTSCGLHLEIHDVRSDLYKKLGLAS